MSTYEVKTADTQGTEVHRISAVTHMRDSNGLTLFTDGGKAVAMFPAFEWMRIAESVVAESAPESEEQAGQIDTGEQAEESAVASPVAEGE